MRTLARRSLFAVVFLVLLLVVCVIALSVDREYQRINDLGSVTLVETVHVHRSAVTTIADSGGSATIFWPSRSEGVIHQKILRNGAVLWESAPGKTYTTAISPDHHYLVIWDQVHTEWWRIYDLSTGRDLEVHLPEHPGMGDGMVPLRFGHWSDDSRSIAVALDGEEVENKAHMRYRETYLLDALDGAFAKQNHCHQPYPEDPAPLGRPNWDNTACAGKYED